MLISKKFDERVRILLRFEKDLLTKKCYQCPVHPIFWKCCNWRQISKLASNFGCLFTFCYSAWTNLIKTKLQTYNLQPGQSICYKLNLKKVNTFCLTRILGLGKNHVT